MLCICRALVTMSIHIFGADYVQWLMPLTLPHTNIHLMTLTTGGGAPRSAGNALVITSGQSGRIFGIRILVMESVIYFFQKLLVTYRTLLLDYLNKVFATNVFSETLLFFFYLFLTQILC